MSPLRARMIEDVTLAGLALGTQQVYIRAVCQLAAHCRRSPDQLSEEEVRAYVSPQSALSRWMWQRTIPPLRRDQGRAIRISPGHRPFGLRPTRALPKIFGLCGRGGARHRRSRPA